MFRLCEMRTESLNTTAVKTQPHTRAQQGRASRYPSAQCTCRSTLRAQGPTKTVKENARPADYIAMNCIQCDLILPEMERQLDRLKAENTKLRMASDPLNPGHRDRFMEAERRVNALSDLVSRLMKLLSQSEPAPDVYVDVQKRSLWRKEKELLLNECSG